MRAPVTLDVDFANMQAYPPFGELLSVSKSGGMLIEYVHDAEHRRVGKKINGT